MAIVVELPLVLARYSDRQTSVEVKGGSVRDVLAHLWRLFPDLRTRVLNKNGELYPYLLLVHNGDALSPRNLDQAQMTDGDTLEIVGLAEGGC